MKTIQEKVAAWEAKRAAIDAAQSAIMKKAEDDGDRTLVTEEKEDYDRLTGELAEVDEHLKRLRVEEQRIKATARAVTPEAGTDPDAAAAARASDRPHILSVKGQDLPPGIEFARYIKAHMIARKDMQDPFKVLRRMYPDATRLHNVMAAESKQGLMLAKANVTGAVTTDSTWGGALVQYQDLLSVFLEWLRPQTIVGRFGTNGIPGLTRVDFLSRVRVQTSGGNGYWVGEGKPKPLTKIDFSNVTMAITKVANIAVMSEEEIRFSTPAADERVRNALAGALIERMDRDFIDPDFAGSANVSPASITYGAGTSAASGTTNSAFQTDTATAVEAVLASFPEATLSGLVWLMSGRTAYKMSQAMNSLGQKQYPGLTIRGGEIGGIPVITSEYLAYGGGLSPGSNNLMILVHAPSIFLADDGEVRIDASNEASLQMLDNPTNDITTPTATSLVSMFQTDSVAIRAERLVNWKRARDGAVYTLTGVNYNGQPS